MINIDVTAATYSGISPLLGGAIGTDELRVSIVNTSARAVSVVRGEVLIDDALVGNVVGAAQETASGAAGTPISLPVTVPADTSSKLRIDWRVAVTATRRLSATLRLPIPRRQFRLRLQFEPGGTKTVPVRSGDVAPVIGGWSALVRLQANRLTHVVMLAGARSTAPTVGTLKVWRTDPSADRPVLTLRRPAGWAMPGWFSVSSLPSGTYIYTLSAGDNVVTAGYIKTHCTGSNATYVAAACINGDARKAPPFGNQYVPPGVLHR